MHPPVLFECILCKIMVCLGGEWCLQGPIAGRRNEMSERANFQEFCVHKNPKSYCYLVADTISCKMHPLIWAYTNIFLISIPNHFKTHVFWGRNIPDILYTSTQLSLSDAIRRIFPTRPIYKKTSNQDMPSS